MAEFQTYTKASVGKLDPQGNRIREGMIKRDALGNPLKVIPGPAWSNPRRDEKLDEIMFKYVDKCRIGHINCPIPAHYAFEESTVHVGVQKVRQPVRDNSGEVERDPQGDVLYTWVDKIVVETLVAHGAHDP